MTDLSRIFILYNAKASLLGKLSYGYRKLTCPADKSPCAACDLTHGGLKLDESAEWKVTKQEIPAKVVQLHQDELTPELENEVKSKQLKFPLVLGRDGSGPFKVLLTSEDLAKVSKDQSAFLSLLSERAQEHQLPWPSNPHL